MAVMKISINNIDNEAAGRRRRYRQARSGRQKIGVGDIERMNAGAISSETCPLS